MWKAYKYIYYWLYTWQKKLWGENDIPEFNAVAGMSLSFLCFIGSLSIVIDLITGIPLIPIQIKKLEIMISILFVVAAHYLAFMHKGKFRKIENEFNNETMADRKKKRPWVLLYAFGSLIFFIFLLFFGTWIKG